MTTSKVHGVRLQRENPKLCIGHNSTRNLCMLAIRTGNKNALLFHWWPTESRMCEDMETQKFEPFYAGLPLYSFAPVHVP